jgi:serine/threonine protein kinase
MIIAKDFIKRCLTIDTTTRITAHEALSHPWLSSDNEQTEDLLVNVRNNFNARRTFKRAVDLVRLSNQLSHKHSSSKQPTNAEVSVEDIKPVNEGIDQVLKIDDHHE